MWTTTNGTAALTAVREAPRVLVGAFSNLSAVAEALRDEERVVVQCSGRTNRFAMDDALCAGHLVHLLMEGAEADVESASPTLNDAARASMALARSVEPTEVFLASTAAGRALAEIGMDGDLALCAGMDRHDVVPRLVDQAVVLEPEG